MNKIQYNFISRRKSANSKKFCKSKFYGFPGITESEKCMHFSMIQYAIHYLQNKPESLYVRFWILQLRHLSHTGIKIFLPGIWRVVLK